MIDARWVGERFATDPAFHLPRRPRFPRELLLLPTADGLCVEGAAERQLLRGKAATAFLPELIALLDGTRSLDDLAAAFPGRPAEHVHHAVTLLYSRGLLEEGPLDSSGGDVASFLGRFVDHTRHHRNRGDAAALLAAASATIVAPAEIASMLRSDLLSAGVGTVHLHLGAAAPSAASDLTIVVETAAFSAAEPAREAALRGGWVLYATVGRDGATVGPLSVPGYSPCYDCYRDHYRTFHGGAAGADERFWAGVIGTNAFNLLSRIAFPQLYNRVHSVRRTGNGYRSVRDIAPRVPSCGVCGCGAELGPHDPAFFAWALHTMTAMPPRALLNLRSYQDHFKPSNIELAQKLPLARPGAATVQLARAASAPPRGVLGAAQLAAVLHQAAGYAELPGSHPRRLTPTGGNLASPELYAIVRAVDGLADGVYRYLGAGHQLERVRGYDPVDARAIAGSGDDGARAIVVGTGLLDRVFTKYHVFAYRVVSLDAGFCLASVMLGAASLGLSVVEHPDFDPTHVAELLRLPARTKFRNPTFVLSLGEPAAPRPAGIGVDVFQRVLHGDVDLPRAPAAALPAPLVAGWAKLLERRRSVRDFAPDPVERAALEQILARATAVAEHHRAIRGRRIALRPLVAVAHDTPGLPAGLYAYHDGLRRTGDLPAGAMGDLFQQENMRSAAAGVFLTADLERIFAGRGARGYGEALTAAGVFAAGIVHAATAAGIASCPSGGFFEHGLRETQDSDGFHDCPLFAVALGHARPKGIL